MIGGRPGRIQSSDGPPGFSLCAPGGPDIVHGMMNRNLIMLALCVVVAASMTGIVLWFSRRLRKIEQDRWGDVKDAESIHASWQRYRTRRDDRRAKARRNGTAPPSEETSGS